MDPIRKKQMLGFRSMTYILGQITYSSDTSISNTGLDLHQCSIKCTKTNVLTSQLPTISGSIIILHLPTCSAYLQFLLNIYLIPYFKSIGKLFSQVQLLCGSDMVGFLNQTLTHIRPYMNFFHFPPSRQGIPFS